jgi:hypothetical protein
MGFQFAETMAGTIEWDRAPGMHQPFSFEVTAEVASTRSHFHDGKARLRGVIHAPPVTSAAPAEGVITIRPIGQRFIRYELRFTGDDGKPYELIGQKDIRLSAPGWGFVHLPAEIFDGQHRRIATCHAAFDVKRDLWSFLRSFRHYDPGLAQATR